MQDYKGAADAFLKALELDPRSDEIMGALRYAMDAGIACPVYHTLNE